MNCLKRRAWSVCSFKGGLAEKEGLMSLMGRGSDTPMHALNYAFYYYKGSNIAF